MSVIPPAMAAAPADLTEPAERAARRRSPWLRGMFWALEALAAAWLLLLIAWLSLHWFILPHIQQWRAQIEAHASNALGVSVTIGRIDVRSSGWVPGLELRDVVLRDAAGHEALRLPHVAAALSPRSLVAFDLRFDQLLIENPELEVRRDPQGRISVAGLDLGKPGGGDDDGRAIDWFFHQREFVIRGGAIRWIDEQRGAEPLALTGVDLVVRNGLREHDLRLDATPGPDWGDRLTLQGRFTQPLLARSGDWKRWSGTTYVDLPRADLRQLRQHVDLPFELTEGNGALRGWFEMVAGEPRAATVDVALREVRMRLAPDLDPLVFEAIEGRFEGRRDEDDMELALRHFGFATGDGIRWPSGDLAFSLRQRDGGAPTGGSFSAQRLDIGVMAQVATRVPIGSAVRRLLADVAPQGTVGDLAATWSGPLDAPDRYQVKATIEGLRLAARAAAEADEPGRPGLVNGTVDLRATESGGDARIGLDGGTLELPGVFAETVVPFDRFGARVGWRIERAKASPGEPRVSVQVKDAKFANADAHGELSATWSTGDEADKAHGGRYPGRLELDGKIADGVATRIARYLPLGIPEATRHYVDRAVRAGTVKAASFRVKGHLRDFPFVHARTAREGEFRIAGTAEDGTFAFIPDSSEWPALTQVAGELVIDRSTLEIRNARATSGTVEWSKVQGGIKNLMEHPVLALDGTARGPLPEMLRIVNTTPIGGWIGRALATSTATGPADLKLGLAIPLSAASTTTVKGSVALAGNDVRLAPDMPLLANAKGRVDFTQKGFTVVGASARVLGGDASFEGGTQADDSIRFSAQGTATSEALRRATELGPLANVATATTGQAAYRLNLGFVRGRTQVLVTSNLVGLASDLPAPLGKAAATPLELRYQVTPLDEPAGASAAPGAWRDTLRLDLVPGVQVSYVREHVGDTTRIVRGGIGVGAPAPTPNAGVGASVSMAHLDVDAWEKAYDRLAAAPAPAPATAAASAPATSAAAPAGPDRDDDYIPDTIALRAQELRSGARRLTGVVLGASDDAGLWRANVNADQLEGYVEFRPSRRRGSPGAGPGRIYARLARLSLPKEEAEQAESLLEEPPAAVPGLDIVVDDFVLRGKRLGRVEIEAANRTRRDPGQEPVREWRLSKLNFTVPEAAFTATGTWAAATPGAAPGAKRRAAVDFKLAVSDSGALVERLGAGKAIRGGKGELSGQIAWMGSPFSPDYPSMTGQVNVKLDGGTFLKAEPGAARLLGVFSLQSIPRRLSLDFRDLTEEGFAFDNVTGDLAIGGGVARTNNLRIRGAAAAVLMEGSADIGRETQDLRVVVVPQINAGTASLAFAAINPAVGLGTFLAQYFLQKPLSEAGTREYRISGPWDDPKVDRVERKRPQAVSAAETPPSSASAPN
jgi:uncharacterized protein (TIGR02099 family)